MKKLAIVFFLIATLLMFSVGTVIPIEYNFIVYLFVLIFFVGGVYCSVSINSDSE
ncbi:hypothetical protein LNK15_03940 [Jeotgalicoccus huakuii]|nr:hypothetical protein [Jeotgalicoccus huakuii]